MDTDEHGFLTGANRGNGGLGRRPSGRARHSVRAVVANQNTLVGKRRRAEDCLPYRPHRHWWLPVLSPVILAGQRPALPASGANGRLTRISILRRAIFPFRDRTGQSARG